MMRNGLRWLPAIAVPALIAAGVVGANASGSIDLPERSPAEVLALVAEHPDTSFSGTVEQRSDLGLPELPAQGSDAAEETSEALEWLSGSHSVRVFVDGPARARFQVLDQLAERDVIVGGGELWLYDSREKSAVHATLPEGESTQGQQGTQFNPVELAEQLLTKLDASTEVSLGSNLNVAGRAAYDLVLIPRTADTLIGSLSLAVDGETGMPLSVSVMARGRSNPAISVAFTKLSLETPDAALFEFTPPAGTDVTEHSVPDKPLAGQVDPDAPVSSDLPVHTDKPEIAEPSGAGVAGAIVTGSDWTTVVELPAASVPAELFTSPLFAQLTTTVDGGRLLSTSLLNVLVTSDGRVLAGAVPVHLLQAAVTGQ
jgi:outer membrane lipoprotein-sorting protein